MLASPTSRCASSTGARRSSATIIRLLLRQGGVLLATAPATIAGKIEVRGLGIVEMPHVARMPAVLLVELADDVERMPFEARTRHFAGVALPVVRIDGNQASAPIKVELALRRLAPA